MRYTHIHSPSHKSLIVFSLRGLIIYCRIVSTEYVSLYPRPLLYFLYFFTLQSYPAPAPRPRLALRWVY